MNRRCIHDRTERQQCAKCNAPEAAPPPPPLDLSDLDAKWVSIPEWRLAELEKLEAPPPPLDGLTVAPDEGQKDLWGRTRCGAILNCARVIHVGDDRHERADGISWHWHETALPHRSSAPPPLDGLREAAQEVADHRHSVFAEGEWCGPMSRLRAALTQQETDHE